MKAAIPSFAHVPAMRWREEALRHYTELSDHVGLTYDPALREAFDAAMAAPLPELWPLFEACASLPLALIHGGAPDVLAEMRRSRPDLVATEIPDSGHISLLDETEGLVADGLWLDRIAQPASE